MELMHTSYKLQEMKLPNFAFYNIVNIDNNDPAAPWSGAGDGRSDAVVPTNNDIDNINDNLTSRGGSTYLEEGKEITKLELNSVAKRIEVIKNEYGIICNEATGFGCGGTSGGNYNDSALRNGNAVTNPGGYN